MNDYYAQLIYNWLNSNAIATRINSINNELISVDNRLTSINSILDNLDQIFYYGLMLAFIVFGWFFVSKFVSRVLYK